MTPTARVDSSPAPACRPANRQWPNSGAPPGIRWSGTVHARERGRLLNNSLSGGDRVRRRSSNRDLFPVLLSKAPPTTGTYTLYLHVALPSLADDHHRQPFERGADL